MPELPEVESYRVLAERVLRRPIVQVEARDAWFLKDGLDAAGAAAALESRYFVAARRIGNLLLLDTPAGGPVLGLRFGMTGRLLVDGRAGVDKLLYTSDREVATWDRFALHFAEDATPLVRGIVGGRTTWWCPSHQR